MPDYDVRVTYRLVRGTRTQGYTIEARSEGEAKRKGERAHYRQGEPGTEIVRVTAERL